MKCIDCDGEMEISRGPHHYVESGLEGVWLANVEHRRCPACGEEEIVIPNMADLHKLIAHRVLTKKGRLAGREMRFLRKSLGWSGVDLAHKLGVDKSTVSRWENDKEPIGLQADRLLRAYVLLETPTESYQEARLDELGREPAPLADIKLRHEEDGWSPDDIAA